MAKACFQGHLTLAGVLILIFFIFLYRNFSFSIFSKSVNIFVSLRKDNFVSTLYQKQARKERKLQTSNSINFDNVKKIASESINLIYQRYEFHNSFRFQFFLASNNIPMYGWEILKYKFAKKAIDGNSSFLMIFGGSSVTAGHDNYFNESWPLVYEKRTKAVFEALGIDLLVHNIAHGANDCRPSNLCYEAMGGNHPDWISWEQSYNCGKSKDIFEIMARVALFSKAVLYFSASGAFRPDECSPSKDPIPWISEDWTPEKAGISEKYIPTKQNVLEFRSLTTDWNAGCSSGNRFIAPLGPFYQGTGHHGFSVWEKNPKCQNEFKNITWSCTGYDMRGPCYNEGGLHYLTKEMALYSRDGGHGKNWHPSAGMHKLRGEALAYNYLNILMDAVYMMEEDLKTMDTAAASALYGKKLDELQSTKPIPEVPYYGGEAVTRPVCYTNYEPHYNKNNFLNDIIVGNHEGWKYILNFNPDDKKYDYHDHKHYFEATGASLEIHLKVSIPRDSSLVILCGYSHKESLKHAIFFLDINATNIGPNYSSPINTRQQISTRKYHSSECTFLKNIPGGNHVVTVSTDPAHPNHKSSLSHLITFA